MSRPILPSLLLACVVPLTLAGDGAAQDPSTLPAVPVVTPWGLQVFHIAEPDAAVSAAWRDNASLTTRDGRTPPPTAGYELANRVIVRGDDPTAALEATVSTGDAGVKRFTPVQGFWVVNTPNVQSAIDTAAFLAADARVAEAYVDVRQPTVLRTPTDPNYPDQWHLNNTLLPIADVNAEPAWDAGYTGAGIVIGIVEGGWQVDHPDLAANFHPEATQPGGSATYHATACAGVAAAVAYNDRGGVGMAYGAQLAAQIYGAPSQTASAFAYRNDLNHIKSNSWGPTDNGWITYLASVERTALEQAVTDGRGGRGEIFVWAAGNGGTNDRVEYDPYASSRFTCAIGAIGDSDVRAYYNETGSSMLAVAHSSGNDRGIFTTYGNSTYTSVFGGTSAACPLASGVIALMLEANPELTWRDVQHVLIDSARICDPTHPSWVTNAAGHDVSYDYGFGAVDAHAAVLLATGWANVRPETVVATDVISVEQIIPGNDPTGLTHSVFVPHGIRIESVELILNVGTMYVGDLEISLVAPSGTESILATHRDDPTDHYVDYIFTSLRHWDEYSAGEWTVTIADLEPVNVATWHDFQLRIYGTRRPGDINCDGLVDIDDIDPFVLALGGDDAYYAAYPDCNWLNADCDEDGDVDFDDINPFADLLTR